MSWISNFVLPLIAAVGMYFLISIIYPDLNQIGVLIVAIVIGWVVRLVLGNLQSSTPSDANTR